MTREEHIEIFVQGTKMSLVDLIKNGEIEPLTMNRTLHFLVDQKGKIGVTKPEIIPDENPLLGIIVVGIITSTLENEGCDILCGCEVVYNKENNKVHVRFTSEVIELDDEYTIDVEVKPQSVTDTLIQMGMCSN